MLNNKITLVTGVGSGIGLATAQKFLKEGATVIGVAKSAPAADLGENFHFIPCDVTNEAQVEALGAQVEQQFGKLDSLVTVCDEAYAAGVNDVTASAFDAASRHICFAPMVLTKVFAPLLKQSENPCIVHDLPVAALMMAQNAMEASLNTAMVNYVRQSTPQLRPVRVNAALFGRIRGHLITEAQAAAFEDAKAMATVPAGRLGTPEDVANLNAFLVSDKARYLNSNIMQVDGGLYTMNPRSMGSAI